MWGSRKNLEMAQPAKNNILKTHLPGERFGDYILKIPMVRYVTK